MRKVTDFLIRQCSEVSENIMENEKREIAPGRESGGFFAPNLEVVRKNG